MSVIISMFYLISPRILHNALPESAFFWEIVYMYLLCERIQG